MTLFGPIQDQKKAIGTFEWEIKNKVYSCIQYYDIFTLFINISKKCENSIKLNTKIRFIFNFPNQMVQIHFFWSWIGPNNVMTLKKPWNYFEKPMSSPDPVCRPYMFTHYAIQ